MGENAIVGKMKSEGWHACIPELSDENYQLKLTNKGPTHNGITWAAHVKPI